MHTIRAIKGPFHKSSYERFLLYVFVEPVLKYGSNEFVARTNLCEVGPSAPIPISEPICPLHTEGVACAPRKSPRARSA